MDYQQVNRILDRGGDLNKALAREARIKLSRAALNRQDRLKAYQLSLYKQEVVLRNVLALTTIAVTIFYFIM